MARLADLVWITPNQGGVEHPAIVIRISSDGKSALVISGTGTGPRDIPHVKVEPHLRATAALRMTKTTYFYQTAIHVRLVGELVYHQPAARCPPCFG
jgi:hypothetical protein